MSDAQLSLVRDVGRVGDRLGRVFTPQSLADAIVFALEIPVPSIAVDPAVGGGAFPKALRKRWPNCFIIGIDIDPDAEGLKVCDKAIIGDWLQIARTFFSDPQAPDVDLVATNPPYTRGTGRYNDNKEEIAEGCIGEHLDACRSINPRHVALLLPAATLFAGPEAEARAAFDRHVPSDVKRIDGRPWPKILREVSLYEWAQLHAAYTRVHGKPIRSPTGRWT